jgi:O-antigen ligase
MFLTYPWTGTGPANYHTLFEHYFSGSLDNERIWSSAHNLYLHQLAERGLLGITALIGALATLGRTAWVAARREATARSLWAAAAIPAFLIMNLTETAFQNEQLTTFLLFIWAWGTTQHAPRKYL